MSKDNNNEEKLISIPISTENSQYTKYFIYGKFINSKIRVLIPVENSILNSSLVNSFKCFKLYVNTNDMYNRIRKYLPHTNIPSVINNRCVIFRKCSVKNNKMINSMLDDLLQCEQIKNLNIKTTQSILFDKLYENKLYDENLYWKIRSFGLNNPIDECMHIAYYETGIENQLFRFILANFSIYEIFGPHKIAIYILINDRLEQANEYFVTNKMEDASILNLTNFINIHKIEKIPQKLTSQQTIDKISEAISKKTPLKREEKYPKHTLSFSVFDISIMKFTICQLTTEVLHQYAAY